SGATGAGPGHGEIAARQDAGKSQGRLLVVGHLDGESRAAAHRLVSKRQARGGQSDRVFGSLGLDGGDQGQVYDPEIYRSVVTVDLEYAHESCSSPAAIIKQALV